MAQRIFVNINNQSYKQIVQNPLGFQFGLGVPTELTDAERVALRQQANEIYFSATDLREKKRKLQIIFDSLTDPKFFGDGAVKPEKLQKYLTDINLLGEELSQNNVASGLGALTSVAIGTAGLTSAASALATATAASTSTVATLGVNALQALAVSNPIGIALYIIVGSTIGRAIGAARQAGREDNAAPWKMTKADFPNLTSQAIAGSPTRRSIERLYDDRSGIQKFNVPTNEALVFLVRQAVADALFASEGVTTEQHPAPGGIGDADKWIETNKQRLARHFNLKRVDGVDENERTYRDCILFLQAYITLIDSILNLSDVTLSRTPDTERAEIRIEIPISLQTAQVPLFAALSSSALQVIREKTLTFFDENREYKTLLNLGNDVQHVAEAWRLAPSDSSSIQLKLLTAIDPTIELETPVFISRELASSVVDEVSFELPPLLDDTPYLRPYNIDNRNYVDSKMFASNTTLVSLGLGTGSSGAIQGSTVSYGDAVFRRWFTADFKSSELNIDFTNYNNFVHFGSAYKRLDAFAEKLKKIEILTAESVSPGTSTSIVSALLKAREKENIIRNFDPYEQFLYYVTSSTAYSASAFYVSSEVEYNATGSWPKQADGTPYSPTSSIGLDWFSVQGAIAQRYDDNNPNYIVLNLPKYIQEDTESTEFLLLFAMVGHLMDNIKVYIDQFPNIYSTNIDPLKELSMDQVYEVAKSFGLELPNIYALQNLQSFNTQFTGESGSRSYVVETWKRFLHSMVYFAKTKGSRTTLDALLNTYGINSPILQIKETTYPTIGNFIRSDELTYGLRFTGSADNNIRIPFVSSSLTASTIQLSFNPILRRSSSLITADTWAIDLVPHPSSSKLDYGRIHVVSGSSRTIIATSSYFPLYSDDYTNLMLRSQSNDISIIQTDGDQILYEQSASVNLSSLWNSTTFIYVGGTGSIKLNNFDGVIDEVRVWGENISTETFKKQAYDPGSYYGTTYTSSYNNLYVHVPFSQVTSSITSVVINESPYFNVNIVKQLPAKGFTTASFTRILRSIKQFTPMVGSTIYTNKKIVVADPPTFSSQFIDNNGTYKLSPITSIKKLQEKQYSSGQNVISFAISPTDFINQNILRSIGVVDVNNLIGSPRYITGSTYPQLETIKRNYESYFKKTINPNEYIKFFKDLVEGPAEMADTMVPARSKLLNGIVIESPILYRNREISNTRFIADGSGTKKFNRYVAGSGSVDIGAYDFDMSIDETVDLLPTLLGYTLPIDGTLEVENTVNFKSSTPSNKLPYAKKSLQVINNSYISSSLFDDNSSYSTVESIIDTETSVSTVSSGYARALYYGIPSSGSVPERFPTEQNTINPFYDIPPRANLYDVGTTSYFHKSTGLYRYDVYTKYKTEYLVKLDTDVDSPLDILYAPITLLSSASLKNPPIRDTATIKNTIYLDSSTNNTGVLKTANIFALYGITGGTGLRIRLYRTQSDLVADKDRSFSTAPTINTGVLFDGLLDNKPDVFPYTLIQTSDATLYYNIDNTTSTDITTTINLHYFAYEATELTPTGYLPRHYKFSRDNGTALKRRNYLGCKNVSGRLSDPSSPIRITLTATNTVTANDRTATSVIGTVSIPTELNNIRFGGDGQLKVD